MSKLIGFMGMRLLAPGSDYGGVSGPLPEHFSDGDTYLSERTVEGMLNNNRFIAPQVFPIVSVQTQYGQIKTWERGSLLRHEMRLHAYADRPVQANYEPGTPQAYICEHWSVERPIAPVDRASSRDPLRPEKDAQAYVQKQAELNTDLRWAKAAFNPNAWAWNYKGVETNPSNASDSPEFLRFDQAGAESVIATLRGKRERMALMTGEEPNVLVMGVDVYNYLTVSDADILERIKYTQRGVATLDLLAELFEVPKIVVARNVVNDAKEGLPANYRYVFPTKGMLLMHAATNPSLETASGGYLTVWERLYERFEGDQTRVLNDLALIRRGYDSRSGVRWVQGHTATGISVVAPDLGMFFEDVVSTSYISR